MLTASCAEIFQDHRGLHDPSREYFPLDGRELHVLSGNHGLQGWAGLCFETAHPPVIAACADSLCDEVDLGTLLGPFCDVYLLSLGGERAARSQNRGYPGRPNVLTRACRFVAENAIWHGVDDLIMGFLRGIALRYELMDAFGYILRLL